MNLVLELLSNWVKANYEIESLIGMLRGIQQSGATAGTLKSTKNSNVVMQEVAITAKTGLDVEIGEIKWSHEVIEGAWGITRCRAVLQYAVPLAKNGSYVLVLTNVRLDANIKLKPKEKFNGIKEFALLYRMLSSNYGGDKVGFCRAMGTKTVKEYNEFGTVDGVLYHELLHVALAKVLAKELKRKTFGELSGKSFDTHENALAFFSAAVDKIWVDWRGLLLHDAGFFDERFIWEKECAYYIKQYEKAEGIGPAAG